MARNQVTSRRNSQVPGSALAIGVLALGWLLCLGQLRAASAPDSRGAGAAARAPAAAAPQPTNAPPAPAFPCFEVRRYEIRGDTLPSTAALMSSLARYTGTNVSVADIVNAASALQAEYRNQGRTNVSVSIAEAAITNGLVTMHVFRGGIPLILVSGKSYSGSVLPVVAVATNAPAKVVPPFRIRAYEITGDTLLTMETLMAVLAKHTGTNLTVTNIARAKLDLQAEYIKRGFATVRVVVPGQQISNGIVKMRVFEGRLSGIEVTQNRYFSSNNVMRALPGLHTNTILVGPVFQAELNRANLNQDRQIYPKISEGPEENTSVLTLAVEDRLPLHGKVEFNDQNSPGTPPLRINSSVAYNNLWQLEHSAGLQYSFSPEQFKQRTQWGAYDQPLVANYSGFYRLALGNFSPVSEAVAKSQGSFGYDEASRKFRLPPPSGRPELNIYGSRSTIDTGLETLANELIYNVPGVRQVQRQDVQQDLTINEAIGFRLSEPIPEFDRIRSVLSAGFDLKHYDLSSRKTNVFQFAEITLNQFGSPNPPVFSTVASPVPTTTREVSYLPLSLRWDGSRRDDTGTTGLGLGYSAHFLGTLFSGSEASFRNVTGSTNGDGNYHILSASLFRDQQICTNWWLSARVEGQWANQPLISNEQFGVGGLAGVRGYHEGEVFGDTGWRASLEQKTPPQDIGLVYPKHPLTVRGSLYMDYGEVYLLDPQGRKDRTPLWGAGFGGVATIGATWEARFLFSWPFLSAGTTEAMQPRFDFGLSAQF